MSTISKLFWGAVGVMVLLIVGVTLLRVSARVLPGSAGKVPAVIGRAAGLAA